MYRRMLNWNVLCQAKILKTEADLDYIGLKKPISSALQKLMVKQEFLKKHNCHILKTYMVLLPTLNLEFYNDRGNLWIPISCKGFTRY